MSSPTDRESGCSIHEGEIKEDEVTQTDGSRITINISVEDEVNDSTPRIVKGLLNMDDVDKTLTEKEWEVVYECRRLGDWLNNKIEKAFEPIRNTNTDRFSQFKRITQRIIDNGINWGRIATIFALGAKFVTLETSNLAAHIFNFLVDFARTRLFSWIVDSGGWQSIKDYANEVIGNATPMQYYCGVAVGTVLVIGFIYVRYAKD